MIDKQTKARIDRDPEGAIAYIQQYLEWALALKGEEQLSYIKHAFDELQYIKEVQIAKRTLRNKQR
jgi:hypothetical protein